MRRSSATESAPPETATPTRSPARRSLCLRVYNSTGWASLCTAQWYIRVVEECLRRHHPIYIEMRRGILQRCIGARRQHFASNLLREAERCAHGRGPQTHPCDAKLLQFGNGRRSWSNKNVQRMAKVFDQPGDRLSVADSWREQAISPRIAIRGEPANRLVVPRLRSANLCEIDVGSSVDYQRHPKLAPRLLHSLDLFKLQ